MNQPPQVTDTDLATIPDDLLAAARSFFPRASATAIVSGHPNLARVSAPSGLWRVRRWPEGTPLGDVTFSHEVMQVVRDAGLTVVPALIGAADGSDSATVSLGGHLYDAQRWLPGEPVATPEVAWPTPDARIEIPAPLPPRVYSEVIRTIARVHEAAATLALSRGVPSAPLSMLPGAVRQAHARQLAALRPRARYEPAIQRWLATGERLMARADPMIDAAADGRERAECILHLNLWPAHVLIENGALSGLLGWERVAAGAPVLDLAQATLRLQGWSDESVEESLGIYGEVRNMTPDERRLLPAVAALDAVATTGRLLEQIYLTPETARPPSELRAAVEMMLRSMGALDRNLNAPSAKSRRRVWNRERPRPGARDKGGPPRERRH
jgi:aminoglycoside phosphotransferase (APT) family kinase protein